MNAAERFNWVSSVKEFREERGLSEEQTTPLLLFSTIKGYHEYRVRQAVGTQEELICVRERNNQYDTQAVLVRRPLQQGNTDGDIVGHVPRFVCDVISTGLMLEWIVSCFCFYTGGIVHGGPVRGGGPQLPCVYLLNIKKDVAAREIPRVARYWAEKSISLNDN